MILRYAIVNDLGVVIGVVNWDGKEAHPYGDVDLRGPIPEQFSLEHLLGKPWELPAPVLRLVKKTDMAPKDLICSKLPWFKFRAEARRILGSKTPETKEQIVEELEKLVGNSA